MTLVMQYVCLVLIVGAVQLDCARILGIFHIPSVSHQMVFQSIWKELSLRGHEVVVMSPNPINDPSLTNLTEVDLGVLYEHMKGLQKEMVGGLNHWFWSHSVEKCAQLVMQSLFDHEEVQKLISDKSSHFDIVLMQAYYPIPAIFSVKFNCPLVGIASYALANPLYEIIGTPGHPVLYPDLTTSFSGDLSFLEKVEAILFYWYHRYFYFYKTLPFLDNIIKQNFGKSAPNLEDILKNMSMVLVNTNPILHKPRPYGPNVIELGGRMHLKPPKPLPLDLQKFLDNSTEGVIYFSLGTNVKSAFLNPVKRKAIMEALSELPYKILWKYENDYMEDQPKNVKISKWLPQQDLLRHKNIKLFIMQGGLQSLEEAITNGVPLLTIPFFIDQFRNAKRLAELGVGRHLDFETLTKESLKSNILELIDNKQYKEKALELGKLLNDESMRGLEKAVWWIEYVIRNKGAAHFRNRVVDMSWYDYLNLDVYGFLILTGFILCFVIYKIFALFIKHATCVAVRGKIKKS